jgi:hypothetical protein
MKAQIVSTAQIAQVHRAGAGPICDASLPIAEIDSKPTIDDTTAYGLLRIMLSATNIAVKPLTSITEPIRNSEVVSVIASSEPARKTTRASERPANAVTATAIFSRSSLPAATMARAFDAPAATPSSSASACYRRVE